jgi:hypothetical protein
MKTALAIRLDAPDAIESFRALGALGKRLGSEYQLASDIIAAGIAASPDARLGRRDDALAAMAQTYVGRLWTVSGNVSTELRRYAASAWKRRDRNLDTAPSEYLTQPRKLAAFNAMRADPKAAGLGQKQMSRILGHRGAVPMSIAKPQNAIRTNEDRPVNALSPNAEFIEAMKRAPAGQAVIKAEHARTVAARQKLIDELAKLDADALKTFPRLDAAIQTEIAATRGVELALKAQNEKLRLAGLAKSSAVIAYDSGRRRIEAELRDTLAAKIVDEFQRSMRDEIDAAMKKHEGGRVQENRPLARDPRERILIHGYGNRVSVAARLDAIHAAIAAAENLRIAADQTDILVRLDGLRAGLPEIEGAVIPTFGGVAA